METLYIGQHDNAQESNMEMWSDNIQTANQEQLLRFIEELERQWCIYSKNDVSIGFRVGFRHFCGKEALTEDDIKNLDLDPIAQKYKTLQTHLGQMFHRSKIVDTKDNDRPLHERVNKIIEQVYDSYTIVASNVRILERNNNPAVKPRNPDVDSSVFRCSTMEEGKIEKLSPYQLAILAILDETNKNGIKRYKGQCCVQIKTTDGYNTRAWKPQSTIQNFVYNVAQKESNMEVWEYLTSRGSCFKDVIYHLNHCIDIQFPEIVKNRHVWSFRNGILIGKNWNAALGKYECKFYEYSSPQFQHLDHSIVSSKYFDQHFDSYENEKDWWKIPTPHFQSILDYQKFDPEVCKWAYVMGGRLCFDVGDMDGWQIIPFFKGIARSGKSTIITKVFRYFYEQEDVRTLSNNIERKFGLSSIYDAFMFISPEVKGDLALEQAEFQSIVSGEDVSVAVKNEKAKSMQWKTPGVLGGNEVPNWKDNSGSVLRRLLAWNFSKQVKDADTQLDAKLFEELPAILLKCVRGYLEYSQKYANKDIWNVTPQYFKNVQKQVAMVASTLHNFMESTNVVYDPNFCCPQKVFVQLFNQHCQVNNLGKPRFNPDFYAGPFSSRDIEVREEALVYNGRAYTKQPFIFGLDVLEDKIQFTDEA